MYGRKSGIRRLQDTATSIGVLTSDELVKMGATNFDDIARTIVGLDVVNRGVGDNTIIIRGINAEGESSATIVWDNMPTSGAGEDSSDLGRRQFDLEVYDVEQVEVLRGPQGTLYGANSLTGVVRFVTKKPNLYDTEAELVAGFLDNAEGGTGWSQKGYLNVPIVEGKVAARIVGYHRDEPGFIDAVKYPSPPPWVGDDVLYGIEEEDINGYTRSGLRASIAAEFDDTDVLLQYFIQNTDSASGPIDRPVDSSIGPLQFPAQGDYKTLKTGHDATLEDLTMLGLTIEHEFADKGTLTFASSYGKKDTNLDADLTGLISLMGALVGRPRAVGNSADCFAPNSPEALALPLVLDDDGVMRAPFPEVCRPGAGDGAEGGIFRSDTDLELFSSELRFASALSGRWNYVAGANAQKRTIKVHNEMLETDPTSGIVYPIGDTNSVMFEREGEFELKSFAAFGEVIFSATEDLDITFGGRFFDIEKTDRGISLVPFFQGVSYPVPSPTIKYDESGAIFKLEAAYHASDDVLLYGIIGQGYRPGGAVNQVLPTMPSGFEHDETLNYEIGAKTNWLEGRLIANLSLYQIEFDDMQYAVDFDGGAFQAQVNCSGKCAEARGAELELTALPLDNLSVNFNISFNKAEITQNLPDSGDPDFITGNVSDFAALDGDPLITRAPELSYSLGAQYAWQVSSRLDAYARADVRYTGEVERTSNDRDPAGELTTNVVMPSFTTGNLKFGIMSDSWETNLFVRNVTNELGAVFQNPTGDPNLGTRTVNVPRTIGVEFIWHTN